MKMKSLLAISLTALTLVACSTNNDVSTFYRKNPAVAGPKTKITAAFILADQDLCSRPYSPSKDDGYRLLGVSSQFVTVTNCK
jgi:PBP1b-binding outer membrane lipoprotein LpoB